jgi:hypothetical protein
MNAPGGATRSMSQGLRVLVLAMISRNEAPRHATGDVGHDGATGELFAKGEMGESAGGSWDPKNEVVHRR